MIPNDSKDYYPTPPALAAELLAGLKIDGHSIEYAGGPILEPSAGSGDLARAIEKAAGIAYNSNGTPTSTVPATTICWTPCNSTASRSPPPSAPPSKKTVFASSTTISSPSRPAPTIRQLS